MKLISLDGKRIMTLKSIVCSTKKRKLLKFILKIEQKSFDESNKMQKLIFLMDKK